MFVPKISNFYNYGFSYIKVTCGIYAAETQNINNRIQGVLIQNQIYPLYKQRMTRNYVYSPFMNVGLEIREHFDRKPITELKTLEWINFNPDFLIRISTLETFHFSP